MFAPQALNAIRIFGMRIKELLFGKRVAEHRVVCIRVIEASCPIPSHIYAECTAQIGPGEVKAAQIRVRKINVGQVGMLKVASRV